MVNESGNSSIAFAESKGEVMAPSKAGQNRDTMVSERSIKFHQDGGSEGEGEPDTTTSVSIRIESENPYSANSHNPRVTQQTPGDLSPPTHDIHAESHEDIHFDAVEEPAPSSVQSVRFQVEESAVASRTGSKVNRGQSPHTITHDGTEGESAVDFHEETPHPTPQQPPIAALQTTQPPQEASAAAAAVQEDVTVDVEEAEAHEQPPTRANRSTVGTLDSAAVNEAAAAKEEADDDDEAPLVPATTTAASARAANAATAAPAAPAEEYGGPDYLPPRRVSPRAATAARSPRAGGAAPTTPRNRSPNSSYRPQSGAADSAVSPAGVPPLAPADEATQAERAAAATAATNAKPQAFARHPTGGSEFSSVADAEGDVAVEGGEAAAAAVTTPASPNVIVTNHTCTFASPAWAAVVHTSRDTIERTVSNETAEAIGVEAQFVRVTAIEADANGMTCDVSIGHAPSQSAEQIDEAIRQCSYANTRMLLEIAGAGSAAAVAEEEEEAAERQQASMHYSFNSKVGAGLITISYSVFPFGSYRHLELSFDGAIEAVTIKYIKECLGEYLGVHESQLVVRRGDEVLSDDATGASLGLANGCTLEAQCTIAQREDTEDVEDPQQATRQTAVAARDDEDGDGQAATAAEVQEEEAAEEPQQAAPAPTPAPPAKAEKAAKKKTSKKPAKEADAAAAPKTKKSAKAPAPAANAAPKKSKKTANASDAGAKAKKAPRQQQQQQQRHNGAAADKTTRIHALGATPHYATPSRTPAPGATPQPSTARTRAVKTPLPRMLTTPRIYHAHCPRPGADSLEEGETMATYLSASRSPARSAGVSVGRRSTATSPAAVATNGEAQSVGRRSASAAPPSPSRQAAFIVVTRRDSADSRATNAPVPPQHTIRGVAAVAFRPRPVICADQSPHAFSHNAVEHQADTHAASRRTHSPVPQQQPGAEVDAEVESVHYVEEEVLEEPMPAQVYAPKEAMVYAAVPPPQVAVMPSQGNVAVMSETSEELHFVEEASVAVEESLQYDYSGEPQQHQQQEEDPVPAAAPNPFV